MTVQRAATLLITALFAAIAGLWIGVIPFAVDQWLDIRSFMFVILALLNASGSAWAALFAVR